MRYLAKVGSVNLADLATRAPDWLFGSTDYLNHAVEEEDIRLAGGVDSLQKFLQFAESATVQSRDLADFRNRLFEHLQQDPEAERTVLTLKPEGVLEGGGMTTIAVLSLFLVLGIGMFVAFNDLEAFFEERRIGSALIWSHIPSFLFISANGLLGLAFQAWALSAPATGGTNAILQVGHPLLKALVIGTSIPLVVRSRWYSTGVGEGKALGPEWFYEWIRRRVLRKLNDRSVELKQRLAASLAKRLKAAAGLPDEVLKRVLETRRPFSTDREMQEIQQEFDNYTARFSGQHGSQAHVRVLIAWAVDSIGYARTKRFIESQ